MRCTSPRTVGFKADGKTLAWSPKHYSKEYAPFQIPCGKCISCRLESARQTAIRCVHEASMHEDNSFITLTYSEENLKSERLEYAHFQDFVKRLRSHIRDTELKKMFPMLETQMERRDAFRKGPPESKRAFLSRTRISLLVTGEYGDKRKRPHWHALIFNWRPTDCVHKYTSDRGDKVYSSETLNTLWPDGLSEIGQVTLESASYCARYALKKLAHGKDGEHDMDPISRRSSRHAIGKSWLEKHWQDVFNHGRVILPGGEISGVPRYYEKWLKKTHPSVFNDYVTKTKAKIIKEASDKEKIADLNERKANAKRSGLKGLQIRRNQARAKIVAQKAKQLITKL